MNFARGVNKQILNQRRMFKYFTSKYLYHKDKVRMGDIPTVENEFQSPEKVKIMLQDVHLCDKTHIQWSTISARFICFIY